MFFVHKECYKVYIPFQGSDAGSNPALRSKFLLINIQGSQMQTIVINLMGAPGTGKSTVASELFSKMKWLGYDVELVSEYAKELVWEERNETFKNELYLFAKQHHRMFRLNNKVKYIITDRPLILSIFYNKKYGDNSEVFKNLVLQEINKFKNINIFLNRTKPYVQKGRNQTEEESKEFASEMLNIVKEHCSDLFIIDAVENFSSNCILSLLKE